MHPRYTAAFSALPPTLQSACFSCLSDDNFTGVLTADTVKTLCQQSQLSERALAFALLPLAAACAHAELSHFNVGAIAHGSSGAFYFGANMEFAGTMMQQTIHAEQSAIAHAWMRGESRLTAITINYTPCGHCRQFMNELNSATTLTIHLPDRKVGLLADYLPDAFGPRNLAITTRLLDPQHHGFGGEGDELAQAAIEAGSHSHAPYSKAYSGVALQTRSGAIYRGSYAENAAFNPSLPPLQVALNLLNLTGENCRHIQRAVLAEQSLPVLTQYPNTEHTLSALGCDDLQLVILNSALPG
ncbi:cytidine deaminase [Enterobacteriaceae bacterium LUAb1]